MFAADWQPHQSPPPPARTGEGRVTGYATDGATVTLPAGTEQRVQPSPKRPRHEQSQHTRPLETEQQTQGCAGEGQGPACLSPVCPCACELVRYNALQSSARHCMVRRVREWPRGRRDRTLRMYSLVALSNRSHWFFMHVFFPILKMASPTAAFTSASGTTRAPGHAHSHQPRQGLAAHAAKEHAEKQPTTQVTAAQRHWRRRPCLLCPPPALRSTAGTLACQHLHTLLPPQ
jgi:hypothetical protein